LPVKEDSGKYLGSPGFSGGMGFLPTASAATAGHLAAELGASRKDGLNHGHLLVGSKFYGDSILKGAEIHSLTSRIVKCVLDSPVSQARGAEIHLLPTRLAERV
jgi:hypothetical protein